MQRVITVDLNGNAYQLDEEAYDALRAYLDLADSRLKDNPDRAEILADFEQAIAEKCRRFLGPTKTVVAAADMRQIVAEMGPVEAGDAAGARTGAESGRAPAGGASASRRLYRIREGAMWAGVCNGLAAYFGVDVAIVRTIFAVVTIGSLGWGVLGYFVLAAILPEAQTSDERAAAHGQPPLTAHDLIEQAKLAAQDLLEQAKRTAADFKGTADVTGRDWKRQWRQQRRQWRIQHRAWRQQWRGATPRSWGRVPPFVNPPPVWMAFLTPVFGVVSLAFFAVLLLVIASIVNTRGVFGFPLPPEIPIWGGILIALVMFQLVTVPIRALRHVSYAAWGRSSGWFAAWDGLFATGVVVLIVWLLARHMTTVENLRDFLQQLPDAFRALGRDLGIWVAKITVRLVA